MKRNTIILLVVLAVLAIVGFFWYRNYQAKKRQELLSGVKEGGVTETAIPGGGTGYSDAFPLGVGSKGSNVLAAQISINQGCTILGEKIAEDGDFGPQTEMASNVCLASLGGHQKGKISYAEFQYLKRKASEVGASVASAGGLLGGLEDWIT